MRMSMLQCKRWGEVFPAVYASEDSTDNFKSPVTSSNTSYTCSRGYRDEYISEEYMDWS
jgi:hypothetical protein